jgi:DNA-directed RNA polymerase subunit alpha
MIKLPTQSKVIKKEKDKAVFQIEALHPGYGITISNTLRRVLLSSLEGAAVTQVKIKGVAHEFSTISGVLEDVVTIILNLKQIRFRMFTDEPQKAVLKVKGMKQVKAADFNLPAQLEIANKDCQIASLTSKSSQIEMEIKVEKGVGYSSREDRQKGKLEIGAISVDAIFTPVKRVSYKIENMRVGERTDYDRIYLEVETDGTISPEQSFYQASKIMVDHFSVFVDNFKPEEKPLKKIKKAEVKKTEVKKATVKSKKKDEKKKKGKKTK